MLKLLAIAKLGFSILNNQTQSSYTKICSTQIRNLTKAPYEFGKNSGFVKKQGTLTFCKTFETGILKIIKELLLYGHHHRSHKNSTYV